MVDRRHEPFEQIGQLCPLLAGELAQDLAHRPRAPLVDGGVPTATFGGDPHEDDATVVGRREALHQAVGDEAVDGACRRGTIHPEAPGEAGHRAVLAVHEHVERIHLALLEWVLATHHVLADRGGGRSATEIDPRVPDAHGVAAIDGVAQVDRVRSAGGASHVRLYATDRWESAAWRSSPTQPIRPRSPRSARWARARSRSRRPAPPG